MKLNLKKDYLESLVIKYKEDLKAYFTHQGFVDANQNFGIEHYKLFMGISKQLKNINILEIGTHHGNSSVALAYGNLFGNNIKIDTYDISNLLQENPKRFFKDFNINYYLNNLFDDKIRE